MKSRVLASLLVLGGAALGGTLVSPGSGSSPSLGVAPANAFGSLDSFGFEAVKGGGGGRYFTGSLRDGFTCGVCHTSETFFGMEVRGLGESIEPGRTYTLTIAWEGEAKEVSFNGEIVGPKGFVAGELSVPEGSVAALAVGEEVDKRQVFNIGTDTDRESSEVEIQWKAPDKSFNGPISVHLAGVRFKAPSGDEPFHAFDHTAGQTFFSAIIPFGKASVSTDDKQGDKE